MVTPLPPIGAGGITPPSATPAAAPGFGDALQRGLQSVSSLEHQADRVAENVATGGDAQVHELMVANTKSQIALDTLVQVRNKAIEAYQEVMRLQV